MNAVVELEQSLERFLAAAFGWISHVPDWAASILILAIAVFLGAFVHRLLYALLQRATANRSLLLRTIVSRTQQPVRLAVFATAMSIAASAAPLTDSQFDFIRHFLLICIIALIAWMAQIALHIWMTIYLRKFELGTADNLLARKHVTQTRILQRVANVLIVLIAISWALMTFGPVRQYGVSLLASAGAAGIVAGLALQPLLKNIFAGIQLAITQPIRIDDALVVEGEWGNVEEITSTYVVLKIWDLRRMILPLSYFIEKPFQNWTRETAALIGSVTIYLDFSVPVQAIRDKVEEITDASPLWDKDVRVVQVIDFHEAVMQVRILASARSGGDAFDLRCLIREKLIDFLQKEYPDALPRMRASVTTSGPEPEPRETGGPNGDRPSAVRPA